MEIIKVLVAMFFGGLASQILAKYFRRRSADIQTLTLVERVNRQVGPKLKGITLARIITAGEQRQLE